MKYYIKAFIYYAVFNMRSSRAEFWYFALISSIVAVLIGILGYMFEANLLLFAYAVFAFVPSIAVSVRRMHDINKSGSWVLINLIPVIGWAVFLYLATQQGTDGPNRFGQPPAVLMENEL